MDYPISKLKKTNEKAGRCHKHQNNFTTNNAKNGPEVSSYEIQTHDLLDKSLLL